MRSLRGGGAVTNRVREKRSPERSCKGDGEETARDIVRNPESSA